MKVPERVIMMTVQNIILLLWLLNMEEKKKTVQKNMMTIYKNKEA